MKKLIFELGMNSATFWGVFGQLIIFYNRPSCVGLCFKWMQFWTSVPKPGTNFVIFYSI